MLTIMYCCSHMVMYLLSKRIRNIHQKLTINRLDICCTIFSKMLVHLVYNCIIGTHRISLCYIRRVMDRNPMGCIVGTHRISLRYIRRVMDRNPMGCIVGTHRISLCYIRRVRDRNPMGCFVGTHRISLH